MVFTNVGIEQLRRALRDRQCSAGTNNTPRTLALVLAEHVRHLPETFQHQHALVAEAADACLLHDQLLVTLSRVLLQLVLLSDMCGVDLGKGALQQLSDQAAKWQQKLCAGAASSPARRQQQLQQHQLPDISSTSSTEQDTADQGNRPYSQRSWSTEQQQQYQQQQLERPLDSLVEHRTTSSDSHTSSSNSSSSGLYQSGSYQRINSLSQQHQSHPLTGSVSHGQQDTRSPSTSLESLTHAPAAAVEPLNSNSRGNSRGSSSALSHQHTHTLSVTDNASRASSATDTAQAPPAAAPGSGLRQLRGNSTLISTADTVVKPVSRSTASLLLQLAHKSDGVHSSSSISAAADGSSTSGGKSSGSGSGLHGDAQRLPDKSSKLHLMQFTTCDEGMRHLLCSGGSSSNLGPSAGVVGATGLGCAAEPPPEAATTCAVRKLWLSTATLGTHGSNSGSSSSVAPAVCTSTLSSESDTGNKFSLCCQPTCTALAACGTTSSAMMYDISSTSSVGSSTNALLQNMLVSTGDGTRGGLDSPPAAGLTLLTDPAVAASTCTTPIKLAAMSSMASPYMACISTSSRSSTTELIPACSPAAAAAVRSAARVPVSGTSAFGSTARCLDLGSLPAASAITGMVHGCINTAAVTESAAGEGITLATYCPRCGLLHDGKCPQKAKCVRCYRKAHLGECWTRCISCNLVHAPGKCKSSQIRQQQQQQRLLSSDIWQDSK